MQAGEKDTARFADPVGPPGQIFAEPGEELGDRDARIATFEIAPLRDQIAVGNDDPLCANVREAAAGILGAR